MLIFRKLRDEYDKLEGALRKLGVDPDTIVGNHHAGGGAGVALASSDEFDDDIDAASSKVRMKRPTSLINNTPPDLDSDLCDRDLDPVFNVVAVTSTNSNTTSVEDNLQPRPVGRLRHLDILEEVSFDHRQ